MSRKRISYILPIYLPRRLPASNRLCPFVYLEGFFFLLTSFVLFYFTLCRHLLFIYPLHTPRFCLDFFCIFCLTRYIRLRVSRLSPSLPRGEHGTKIYRVLSSAFVSDNIPFPFVKAAEWTKPPCSRFATVRFYVGPRFSNLFFPLFDVFFLIL